MSIKNLFGKSITSYENVAKDVESTDFIDEVVAKRETYLPPIDFSDPANFAFYGSAELYYEAAIKRVYEDYPYDGSKAEQIEFEERSSFLERWLFENKYPKTTGHAILGTSANISGSTGDYADTSVPEYIEVHGGLHIDSTATNLDEHFEHSTKYNAAKNRTQNFNCDLTDKGITIEFWMKKTTYTGTNKEVILDLWNGVAVGAGGYSRVLVETFDDGGSKKMAITIATGTTSDTSIFTMGTTETDWNHYAFSVIDGDTAATARFYTNGEEKTSTTLTANFAVLSGRLDCFIGAMQNEISSGQGATTGGKLSAQLDEFRFWKTRRTSRQIKLNWFREIGGGANTDDNTSDLGLYLKFNEGITGINSVDSTTLDYSGRLANGTWVGYPGSSARSTDSAITSAGYTESATPIIYSNHPFVTALEAEMTLSGSDYDSGRGQAFYRSLPNWLIEEDQNLGDENLRKLSQILASYLDTLRVQIESLNSLKDKEYVPQGHKAAPFAADLLKDKGFVVSDMFLSAEVLETFSSIDYDAGQYDLNIEEVKNLIYTNIYNNLENIYGSKGTEKSIRNLIRCFGIDDEIIKLNQYTDLGIQYLGDKYRTTTVKKKYINLNSKDFFSGSIYQSGSKTFISGALEASVGAFTLEADILVPYKKELGENGFFATPFLSASVMGFHEANPTDPSDFTWHAGSTGLATASLGLSDFGTNEIIFRGGGHPTQFENMEIELISTDQTSLVYEFTSSLPLSYSNGDVYNGNVIVDIGASTGQMASRFVSAIGLAGHAGKLSANIAIAGSNRVEIFQVEAGVEGNTAISSSLTDTNYIFIPTAFVGGTSTFAEARDLQVYLVRDSSESKHAKFVVKNQTETIYQESDYVYDIYNNEHYNVALRIKPQTYPYAGNVTNTTPDYDIELYAVSHNFDELKEEVLVTTTVNNTTGSAYLEAPKRIYAASHYENFTGSLFHKTDLEFGRVSAWLDYLPNSSIQEHNKDVLNYGQSRSIIGSNAFLVDNKQVPSLDLSILNWDFDTVTATDSSGEFFIDDITSGSTDTIYGWIDDIIRREHTGKGQNFPTSSTTFLENEFLYANKKQLPETSFNANNIFIKGDEEINFGQDDDISDNLFILEKSPAAIVSEEMLKLFSTTQEFSNLFGRNIDKYRIEYKELSKARQLFYQRVGDGLDFDKFFTYFKWIDQSISEMINQLIPASVNFAGGVVDVIEPHILERDKYQRQIGLLQTVTSTEASIRGVQELRYNWRIGHAPLPSVPEYQNSLWQKERRDRDLESQQQINKVLTRQTDQEFTNPIYLSGSNGVYSGSAYATRRFSRTVQPVMEFNNSIHGGTNYVKGKDRDLLRSGIGLHSTIGTTGAPKNVITFGAGLGYGLNVLESLKSGDTIGPNEKIKYDGFGLLGKFTNFVDTEYAPLSPDLDYYSRRKVSDMFIGNIISSSVNTGYNSKIFTGDDSGFRDGVNIVNLHSDTTDITNEVPMQSPFTERWVGGHQGRHVELNSVGKTRNASSTVPNDLDSEFSRPESWRLLVGKNPILNSGSLGDIDADADGAIGFTAPDYGIGTDGRFPDEDRMYAIFYREERAKRSLNIKNIQTTTSSVYHGNYQHEYEVFSTFGDQGYFLKRAGNLLPDAISQELPETTNYLTVVAQSIGAPGNLQLNSSGASQSNRFAKPSAATALIETVPNVSLNDGKGFTLTNAGGDTVKFVFDSTIDVSTNTNSYNAADVVSTTIGYDNITAFNPSAVGDEIVRRINAGTGMDMVASKEGANVLVTQSILGETGNTAITEPDGPTGLTLPSSFTGGGFDLARVVETQDRSTGSAHVIRTRFSAPGGPEANSSGYLDVASQQYSVYNSMNFRNLSVRGSGSGEAGTPRVNSHSNRREGLRTLRTRHQGQFGIDSQYGTISSADYSAEASFHKQHRNTRKVAKLGDFTNPVWTTETSGAILAYDNDHFNTPIPASDFQYSWVNSAISGSNWEDNQIILTYAPRNGLISSSAGITEALVFPSSSLLYGE